MNNDNEFNYTSSNEFKQVNKNKKSGGFGSSVLLPFISGMLGATLILGIGFGVPEVKNKLFNVFTTNQNTSTTTTAKQSSTQSSNSEYNATLMDIAEYSETSVAVAEKVLPSVVGITVTYNVQSAFGGTAEAQAAGSGIIITEDGYIITNNHVISSESTTSYYQITEATSIQIHIYGESDDTLYEAEIIGTDETTDLAVLKIDKNNLVPIEIGDSDNLRAGEFVMAVGNPMGMNSTVTCGVISALEREITSEGKTFVTIQTDAPINAGNSGGALVNSKGELIGINTLKLSSGEGIGFAIPINSSVPIIDQLIEYGTVKRPYIGITGSTLTESTAKRYNVPEGIYVEEVLDDGPAKGKLEVGDIITEAEGIKVTSINEINNVKNTYSIGDKFTLKVYRDNSYIDITITLAETPEEQETTSSSTNQNYYNNYYGYYYPYNY